MSGPFCCFGLLRQSHSVPLTALNSQKELSVSASEVLGLKVWSITPSACMRACASSTYVQVSTEPRHKTSPGAGGNYESPGRDCEN